MPLWAFIIVLLAACATPLALLFFRNSEVARSLEIANEARRDAQERNDRLMEAVARRSGTELVMPSPAVRKLEVSDGWWDKKPPKVELHVTTPSQQEKN